MGLLALLGFSCNSKVANAGKHSSDYVQRDVPAGQLVKFYYVRQGTISEPFNEYELTLTDDETVKLYAHNLGKIHDTVMVAREVIDTVAKMIIDNEIYRYKDNFQPDMEVMDGEGWHYSAQYSDKTSLSSGGTNAWPAHFALPLITAYLDSVAVGAGAGNKGFEGW